MYSETTIGGFFYSLLFRIWFNFDLSSLCFHLWLNYKGSVNKVHRGLDTLTPSGRELIAKAFLPSSAFCPLPFLVTSGVGNLFDEIGCADSRQEILD